MSGNHFGGRANVVANFKSASDAMEDPQSAESLNPLTFGVGDAVQLKGRPKYLKTADPMPMLRPPDLVDSDEQGQVLAIKARNQFAVRFRRGTFLLDAEQLQAAAA
jgi:hypothetical protein